MRGAVVAIAAVACLRCGSSIAPPAASAQVHPPSGILPPEEWQGTPKNGGTITVIVPTEPAHLLYLIEADLTLSRMTVPLIYETLAWNDPSDETGERFVPRLATKWAVSPDGLTYTFDIRAGVRWHDGVPFTVDNVLFTFDTVMNGARSGHIRSALTDLQSWKRTGESAVQFVFNKPYFKSLDALASVPIIPKQLFATGDISKSPNLRNPVGTGPFRFASWDSGSKTITYNRNEDYWGPSAHVDRLAFRAVEDRTVAAQLMDRGEADAYSTYLPEQWLALANDAAFLRSHRLIRNYGGGYAYVGWNEKRPFFLDTKVRTALAMLANLNYVTHDIERGLYAPNACALYFRSLDCDPSMRPPPFDPAGARVLLDEAGWIDHDGDGLRDKSGIPFRFTYVYPEGSHLAESVGVMLADEFRRSGIEMNLQVLEWATYIDRIHKGEFDATGMAWGGGPRTDPYSIWHTGEGRNWIGFSNPIADGLLEAARADPDNHQRHAEYRAFGKELAQEAPYIWLGANPTLGAISTRVHGVTNAPDFDYASWWVEP